MPPNIAAHAADSVHIHLQDEAEDIVIESSPGLKTIAMRWAYVVRNRVRWAEDEAALASVRKSAREGSLRSLWAKRR